MKNCSAERSCSIDVFKQELNYCVKCFQYKIYFCLTSFFPSGYLLGEAPRMIYFLSNIAEPRILTWTSEAFAGAVALCGKHDFSGVGTGLNIHNQH